MIKTKRTAAGKKYTKKIKIKLTEGQLTRQAGRQEIKPNAGCRHKLIIVLVLFHCSDSLCRACVSHIRLPLTPIWFTVEIPFLSLTDFFTHIIYIFLPFSDPKFNYQSFSDSPGWTNKTIQTRRKYFNRVYTSCRGAHPSWSVVGDVLVEVALVKAAAVPTRVVQVGFAKKKKSIL